DLRWLVFFPVGKQPAGSSIVKLSGLPRHITINLHGFFFLDSERLRIDGLEECFNSNGSAISKACIDWNRTVATQGALINLPGAIANFARAEALTPAQCLELAGALRKTWERSKFRPEICQGETWRPRWRSGVETWERISAETNALPIPHIADPDEILSDIP